MKKYLYSILNTITLIGASVAYFYIPDQRFFWAGLVFWYLLGFNMARLHEHHKHLISKNASHVWRMNAYSVVLPFIAWLSTNILLQWFYGIQFWIMAIAGIVTIFTIFVLHEHSFEHLKIKNHNIHLLKTFAKNIVFFYSVMVLYGYAYLFESTGPITPKELFWITFLLSYLLMWQEHHKYKKHSIHTSSLLAIISWMIGMYAWFIYWLHLPHITGSLIISVFYGVMWSIFFHYSNKTLTKNFIWELIAIFMLLNVVLLTVGNFGQIV